MKKTKFYKQDWLIALVVGAVFGIAILVRHPLLERLEVVAYDIGVRATHRTPGAAQQVVIVAVDDPSIGAIGRWPWSRGPLAEVLERLSQAKARTVGVLIDLTEPQLDPGLASLRNIRDRLNAMPVPNQARRQFGEVRRLLNRADKELDADRLLAQAMRKTPRLHLPMFVEVGDPPAGPVEKTPDYVARHRFMNVYASAADSGQPLRLTRIQPPTEQFARHATGMGHLSFFAEPDHAVRAVHTALEYDGNYYPSLALLLAASSLNLDLRHIELDIGTGIKLGKLFVPTDRAGRTYTAFYRPPPGTDRGFSVYSFHDVQTGKVPPSVFTEKIVLVGLAAGHVGARFATPTTNGSALMPEPELAANIIASILNQDFYTTPDWALWAQIGIAAALVLYLMFAMPRMNGNIALLVSLLLLIGLLGAEQFLMVTEKIWLQAVSPAILLFVGHLAIATKRFVLGERAKADTDSVHDNRMLGLAFQTQGQLDMAMDKFRKLPADESVLELIYNLALDFERKRQFHKAAAAYDYILDHNPRFRDCVERKKRTNTADHSIALGKTLILSGTEKPMLGRYLVEKELGRGAMGTVYLGRDPKINRRVAIKTMVLSPELKSGTLSGIRARFFREAETAGRLHHPNIVTIYDAGEEHDLAYIAMEYLEGKDLGIYIQRGQLLPFDWILDVAIKVADALDYAHRNDVVHRDIKPSNIVYHEATGGVKVTDFGIARITDASHTKTGTILGTPSYMSPEQISGKPVDGRSDLFSFGSMLFELVTGQTPFTGDSLATLTHQIVNAATPDIRKLRPDAPVRLIAIIKRLLQKQVAKRFQTGDELKAALQQCRSTLDEPAKA